MKNPEDILKNFLLAFRKQNYKKNAIKSYSNLKNITSQGNYSNPVNEYYLCAKFHVYSMFPSRDMTESNPPPSHEVSMVFSF